MTARRLSTVTTTYPSDQGQQSLMHPLLVRSIPAVCVGDPEQSLRVRGSWIRDTRLPADDEDCEWPAVFVVKPPPSEAQRWGDHLAQALRTAHRRSSSASAG